MRPARDHRAFGTYPVNYLLDGQQRLSTICGALYWQGNDPNSRWNLAYDLREKSFIHLDTLDDPPLYQLRLNKLTDPSAYFQHDLWLRWHRFHGISAEERDGAERRVSAPLMTSEDRLRAVFLFG